MAATDETGAPYAGRIDRAAFAEWINARIDYVEAQEAAADMLAIATAEGLTHDEAVALWLLAGIASQIGLALALDIPKHGATFVPGAPDPDASLRVTGLHTRRAEEDDRD